MTKIKKVFLATFSLVMLAATSIMPVLAQSQNPGWFQPNPTNNAGIEWLGAGTDQGENLVQVVRNAVNRVLGILGLIVLIILLYGGFQMVTAAGDEEKYNSGFKILKQAGIWLIFIGLARFVVSIIFFLIGVIT